MRKKIGKRIGPVPITLVAVFALAAVGFRWPLVLAPLTAPTCDAGPRTSKWRRHITSGDPRSAPCLHEKGDADGNCRQRCRRNDVTATGNMLVDRRRLYRQR